MVLACPQCGSALEASLARCSGCAQEYPVIGGVPWLVSEPLARLSEWKNQSAHLIAHFDREIDELQSEAADESLGATTRSRLKALRKAKIEQKKTYEALLSPLQLNLKTPVDVFTALKVQLPVSQNLLAYDTNVHRDWCWGEEENKQSADIVKAALPSKLANLAVFGSGASRLAYDLHTSLPDSEVFATDINPLMVLAAQKITSGEALDLYEFPKAPLNRDALLAKNHCSAPRAKTKKFHLLFGDVWDPPFEELSLDLVLTPWLLDILPFSAREVADRINHILIEGGTWIYFGSLAYQRRRSAEALLEDELSELLEERGFRIEHCERFEIPYLKSPHESLFRRERVLLLKATKQKHQLFARRSSQWPAWLDERQRPVPMLPAFHGEFAMHDIQARVLSLVDGKRSVLDISREVEKLFGLDSAEASQAVLRFFLRLTHT